MCSCDFPFRGVLCGTGFSLSVKRTLVVWIRDDGCETACFDIVWASLLKSHFFQSGSLHSKSHRNCPESLTPRHWPAQVFFNVSNACTQYITVSHWSRGLSSSLRCARWANPEFLVYIFWLSQILFHTCPRRMLLARLYTLPVWRATLLLCFTLVSSTRQSPGNAKLCGGTATLVLSMFSVIWLASKHSSDFQDAFTWFRGVVFGLKFPFLFQTVLTSNWIFYSYLILVFLFPFCSAPAIASSLGRGTNLPFLACCWSRFSTFHSVVSSFAAPLPPLINFCRKRSDCRCCFPFLLKNLSSATFSKLLIVFLYSLSHSFTHAHSISVQ